MFKKTGFDSIIGEGVKLDGTLTIPPGKTVVIEGVFTGKVETQPSTNETAGSSLVIDGSATLNEPTVLENLEVSGSLVCLELTVKGKIKVHTGAKISAKTLRYRDIVLAQGAILSAHMEFTE